MTPSIRTTPEVSRKLPVLCDFETYAHASIASSQYDIGCARNTLQYCVLRIVLCGLGVLCDKYATWSYTVELMQTFPENVACTHTHTQVYYTLYLGNSHQYSKMYAKKYQIFEVFSMEYTPIFC